MQLYTLLFNDIVNMCMWLCMHMYVFTKQFSLLNVYTVHNYVCTCAMYILAYVHK